MPYLELSKQILPHNITYIYILSPILISHKAVTLNKTKVIHSINVIRFVQENFPTSPLEFISNSVQLILFLIIQIPQNLRLVCGFLWQNYVWAKITFSLEIVSVNRMKRWLYDILYPRYLKIYLWANSKKKQWTRFPRYFQDIDKVIG